MDLDGLIVRQRLARGGMAEVWIGETRDGVRVALKRLRPDIALDASVHRAFLSEARITQTLLHPNVVRLWGVRRIDEVDHLVMELVDGLDAHTACRLAADRGVPIAEPLAAFVVAEVAAGLRHAHDARDAEGRGLGIVHRDVNPPNVLLSRAGDVKLSDFGIAKAKLQAEQTATGVVKGKVAYLSPEQVVDDAPVSPKTDVYALGATLHALCAGVAPLHDFAAASRRFLGGPLTLSPLIDPQLRAIVAACMELDPDDRPRVIDVEAWCAELSGYDRETGRAAVSRWLTPLTDVHVAVGELDNLIDFDLLHRT